MAWGATILCLTGGASRSVIIFCLTLARYWCRYLVTGGGRLADLLSFGQTGTAALDDFLQVDENGEFRCRFDWLQRDADAGDGVVFIEITDDENEGTEPHAIGIFSLSTEAALDEFANRQRKFLV